MIPENILNQFPKSILVKSQKKKKIIEIPDYEEYGRKIRDMVLVVFLRYDDDCGDGHNSFSITGECDGNMGCIHDTIAKYAPHLIPYLKWHLCSSDGPMYYIENTTYHAGDTDYNGMKKGEKRWCRHRDGTPLWQVPHHTSLISSDKQPPNIEWEPYYQIGEGKERDLDAARRCAIWPDATDEDLCRPKEELTILLNNRVVPIMWEFKEAMDSLGFVY